jgi:hypothetical protein
MIEVETKEGMALVRISSDDNAYAGRESVTEIEVYDQTMSIDGGVYIRCLRITGDARVEFTIP